MLASEILDGAAALIEPEGRWTQGKYAADRDGHTVDPRSPKAVCWCARGARARAAGEFENRTHDFLRRVVGDRQTIRWNDDPDRTQAEVVAALRQAAELARKAGR
jgi:hypothetical protein